MFVCKFDGVSRERERERGRGDEDGGSVERRKKLQWVNFFKENGV